MSCANPEDSVNVGELTCRDPLPGAKSVQCMKRLIAKAVHRSFGGSAKFDKD